MNADLVARLSRTLLQVIGASIATYYTIDQAYMTAIVGALVTIITTLYTIQASRKGGGDNSTLKASPIITIAAIIIVASMLAGCSLAPKSILDNPGFATAVGKAASATKTAGEKADEALDAICGNYQTVDAAFQLVAFFAGDRIPQSVRQSEAFAVAGLTDLCTNRPKDAQTALVAAQKAYGVIVTIRDQFKS